MYPNQGWQSLQNQGPWPQRMAGTKTPTQMYSTGRQPELANPHPPYSSNVYPPGNVCPAYPHNASTRAPQFRQNVSNPAAVGPQYPMSGVSSSYQCPPVNKCFQGKPYSQELPQSSAQYSGLTYPVQHPYSMRNQLPSNVMSSRMPCQSSVQNAGGFKGETAWAQCNQTYSPQYHNNAQTSQLSKRPAEDLNAPDNPPSKRMCPDQGGQPYSVQVNGYQKGLHIQGSCYLTVSQDGHQQKAPAVSNALGCGSTKSISSLPAQNKPASYVQDHLDVSVTPVLPNSQTQNNSPTVSGKELNPNTAMKAILALVNIAMTYAPNTMQWFETFKSEHNALCLPDKLTTYLLPLIKSPTDKHLLQFYVNYKSRLCYLANEGRCPLCGRGLKMPNQNGGSQAKGISQGDKCQPLAAMQSAAAHAGQNVMSKSTKNNRNFCRTPFAENHQMRASIGMVPPHSLNEGCNPGSPNISSTFLSESEFKDTPYSASIKPIDNGCKSDNVNSQVTYPPNSSYSPHLSKGMPTLSTSSSVSSQQITSPYAITANTKPNQHMWQPGNINTFAAYPPSVTQNQQGINRYPTYNSVANNLSVTSSQPLTTSTAKPMNYTLPKGADMPTQLYQLHNKQLKVNYPALNSVMNNQIRNSSSSASAGANNVGDAFCSRNPHLVYASNQPHHKQQMENLQVPSTSCSNPSARNTASVISPKSTGANIPGDAFCPRNPHLVYASNQPHHKQQFGNLQIPSTGCSNPSARNTPSATSSTSPSTYPTNRYGATVLPQQSPSLERSDNPSEPKKTLLQTSSPSFRQQAASLMKLPESITSTADKKPPVSSGLPTTDIMNCFSLKPHTETKVSPQSTKSRHSSNEASSGMILPHRILSECIVIEDSDDEGDPSVNTSEASVVNAFACNSAASRDTTNSNPSDSSQAEEVRSLSSNPLTYDPTNSSESNPKENSAASPQKLDSGEQPQDSVLPPKEMGPGSSKDNGDENCAKETSYEKLSSVPLSDALQLLEEDKSLDSMVACGEATFATFVFDEGTGDLEITTAEFGEEEWEQLMRG